MCIYIESLKPSLEFFLLAIIGHEKQRQLRKKHVELRRQRDQFSIP
jgi:hypothetical protein